MITIPHDIGPTFGGELLTCGLGGLPISWTSSSVSYNGTLTADQVAALTALIASHDATKQPAKTYVQAISEGYEYLATLGWDDGHLQIGQNYYAASIDASNPTPPWDAPTKTKWLTNLGAVSLMWASAKQSPSTFNATSFTIPYKPSDLGL